MPRQALWSAISFAFSVAAVTISAGLARPDDAAAALVQGYETAMDAVPLYDDLGTHHHGITTDVEAAQAYFDQGLRLQYAFNHAEAIRSYREALRHDPGCAMCWWGIALASGPNINAPMSPEDGHRAYEAIREALELTDGAGPAERLYIEALAARYAADPAADRAPLDSAYARAMASVAEGHPDDPDALTLYAASLMNLSPWAYWTGDFGSREPRPGTPEILGNLERALELDPDHPGACHYYIHAVEAAYPKKAEPCADRLARLMPGAGHIVHMPGHIYIRVGRYADAVKSNEHAVHADETYIADQRPGGLYPAAYYPHNYHFMAFAATMAGMSEKAIWAARKVAPKVPIEIARVVYWVQNVIVMPQLTLVTFGRWDEVLAEPEPPADLAFANALYHYSRGIAYAATGRPQDADAELQAVREIARAQSEGAGTEGSAAVIVIAEHALAGEIALRTGRAEEAVAHFERAAELEDGMLYEEPPLWYYPVRHALGRSLLEAGRAEEAERRYREDLLKFPANGWSLYGLSESLRAQGKTEEARAAMAEFREAWTHADIELTSSHL